MKSSSWKTCSLAAGLALVARTFELVLSRQGQRQPKPVMMIRRNKISKVYLHAELDIAWTDIHRVADHPNGVAPEGGPRPAKLRRIT